MNSIETGTRLIVTGISAFGMMIAASGCATLPENNATFSNQCENNTEAMLARCEVEEKPSGLERYEMRQRVW